MWRIPAAISASVVAVTFLYSTLTGDDSEPAPEPNNQPTRPLAREDGSSTESFDHFDDDAAENDDEEENGGTRRGDDSPLDITPGWGFYADITPEVPMYRATTTTAAAATTAATSAAIAATATTATTAGSETESRS